ncbi:hypothetical protein DES39_2151 [Orbus hercynius]|uniref:Uncharacterized protein n=1 Tax=Orbus hercynius TaxID=593135 RepID=A0A495RAN6_9GAMM|nr:hypothetical protein [Orbus hercynius]RKS84475.1 hypothetical protein DES39_2151 [Orbus hercynius]
MPVDLTKLPQPLPPLQKFSGWFWAMLLFAFVVAGGLITLIVSFFYSLSDLLLILCAVVVPIGLWVFSLLYGIYYRGYREAYIKQWNINRNGRREHLIDYARRGLYVLSHSVLTRYGESGNANGVTSNSYSINGDNFGNDNELISYKQQKSYLDITPSNFDARLEALFIQWCNEYQSLLTALPNNLQIHVRLFIETPTKIENIEALWQRTFGKLICPASIMVNSPCRGTLFTQVWLDNSDYDDDLLLLINARLFAFPIKNDAEEALIMLLAGEQAIKKLTEVVNTDKIAKIYRSEQTGELAKTLDHALLWGAKHSASYDGVWYSGISTQQNIDIMNYFNQIEFDPGSIFNIDTTIGNAKHSAYFFALALAVEHTLSTGNKQLIVVGEPDITASVVATITNNNQK